MSQEEKKAIKALKALEKIWPPSLWIFCSGGSLNVLRVGDRGERVMDKMGNVEQDNFIASFDIPNDGGDW